ncbi:chitobiosyldiphosphodolichol beta-mannosyltransferase-like [Pyrus ussuriensis x Pyrus communis]|uniref:Chitobiosyldiphosphodolichol beta-mannosyltransferase-like n=1 Tax=Pyrus ussuriensis x Pyrus communis TaxID=2448454 RepID=A0A5N5G8H9_9ROSA|nr:chitobiosyldiphosphodolichol beta-mannosyltransferase-like [Pyrus ussuriensis x Pyrus communis]
MFRVGLDVFEDEPYMKPGLADLKNVVVVRHIASASKMLFKGFPNVCDSLKVLRNGALEMASSGRWATEWEEHAKALILEMAMNLISEVLKLQSFFAGLAASGALTSGLRLMTKAVFEKSHDGLRKGTIEDVDLRFVEVARYIINLPWIHI